MAKERLSRLQKEIIKALLEISTKHKEGEVVKQNNVSSTEYPSLCTTRYLTSRVADKYYDYVLKTIGNGGRFFKNIVISRKATVVISRSLRNLEKKGLVTLYDVSKEVRLTEKGVEIAKKYF